MRRILECIKNPLQLFVYVDGKYPLKWIPTKMYLKILYRAKIGRNLNLDEPTTYNEKLQWLKIYDRNPKYTDLVDKHKVKKIVEERIGKEYIIPTIRHYQNVDEIKFEELPEKFVLKCTHDSGGVFVCKNKKNFDFEKAKNKMQKIMGTNYYWHKREWPYKNVTPQIICEQYIEDNEQKELRDYKFFCFDGEPKLFFVATDRERDTKFNFYDLDFNPLPIKNYYDISDKEISAPKNLEKMIELAKILSKDIPHVRVDFYEVNGEIYFGELTFYHFSGLNKFEPEKYDKILGDYLKLPNKIMK